MIARLESRALAYILLALILKNTHKICIELWRLVDLISLKKLRPPCRTNKDNFLF